jgi:uncharacterized delta-60 repeat protein
MVERLEDRTLLNAGSLDPTFGTAGLVTTPFRISSGVTGLVLQADGKVVAAGTSSSNLILERYNSDGTPDSTFGTAGQVSAALNLTGGVALALQADGKIVVAASSTGQTSNSFKTIITRYLADGTVDATFGTAGQVAIGGIEAGPVTIQSDGKIVVAATTVTGGATIQDLAMARLNADGSLDNTFGTSGRTNTPISGNVFPVARGLGIQANGRIIVSTGSGTTNLLGFSADGSLDTGFGTGGITTTDSVSAGGLAVLADGRIVLSGTASGTTPDFAILRYFANGALDASFGTNGRTVTDFGFDESGVAVAVQADGRYVVVGGSDNVGTSSSTFALARYNPNGSLDTTFGAAGKVTTTFTAGSSTADGVVVQTDGRIIAAGQAGSNFALARYTADTPLPTANQRFVAQAYLDLLGRPVDGVGLGQWSNLLDKGTSRADVSLGIESSPEYAADTVNSLYALYLRRTAEKAGLDNWTTFLRSGGTVEQVITFIVSAPEFVQGQGKGTNDGFLDAFYQDALDRAVDPTGRAGWDQALAHGTTFGQVAFAILGSPEYRQDLVTEAYGWFLRRQPDSGGLNAFMSALAQGTRDEQLFALIVGSKEYSQRIGA